MNSSTRRTRLGAGSSRRPAAGSVTRRRARYAKGDPPAAIRVLYVEDNADDAVLVTQFLEKRREFSVQTVERFAAAQALLNEENCDLLLLDLGLPDGTGIALVEAALETNPDMPLVVLTGNGDEKLAVRAVNAGAQEYLYKDRLDEWLLSRTLRHAVERHRLLSELKKAHAVASHHASHDPLTGLANRHLYFHTLERTLAGADRQDYKVAVLFVDVDHFKRINDLRGHSAGDDLLKTTADLLRRTIRRSDEVARIGGDEFVITLSYRGNDGEPARVAGNIIRAFAGLAQEPSKLGIALSVGIAVCPNDGTDPNTLVQRADRAMYAVKQRGGNAYGFYSTAIERDATKQLAMELDMTNAVGTPELFLNYQPQFDVETRTMRGVEALLRWKHPTLGLVPPEVFIPVAEKTGHIHRIGECVLELACRRMKGWLDQGLPELFLAVNVSAHQLLQKGFVAGVARTLETTGLAPDSLELEITESAFVDPSVDSVRIFGALKELGVSIAIDDFGKGYASFGALRRLPVDGLKLDQSFVAGALDSEKNTRIVEAIIAMAAKLGLSVVAEGVETPPQMEFLRERGCRIMQGFLFARPMAARDFGEVDHLRSVRSSRAGDGSFPVSDG